MGVLEIFRDAFLCSCRYPYQKNPASSWSCAFIPATAIDFEPSLAYFLYRRTFMIRLCSKGFSKIIRLFPYIYVGLFLHQLFYIKYSRTLILRYIVSYFYSNEVVLSSTEL